MNGLARQVQEGLGRDPFAGDVFVFRGRSGSLIKALWHDGIGLSLYAKRLDRGRFVWPQTVDGVVALTAGQMSYLPEVIDWRNPQRTWRPSLPGRRIIRGCIVKKGRGGHGVCDSLAGVNGELAALPDDIDALKTALLAARAVAATAIAQCSSDQVMITLLKLEGRHWHRGVVTMQPVDGHHAGARIRSLNEGGLLTMNAVVVHGVMSEAASDQILCIQGIGRRSLWCRGERCPSPQGM